MNNLLLTLAMAALGQLGSFGGGPGLVPGYGPGLPGAGLPGAGLPGAGLPPGMGFAPGPGSPIGAGGGGYGNLPHGGFGAGGLRPMLPGRGPLVIVPGPDVGRQAPVAGLPQQQPDSEAEAFGLAPYR